MANITSVKAIQILDSRGLPTVSCRVETDDGLSAISKVPSGASTGEREALELRDGGNEYLGKAVLKAVNNINTKLANVLILVTVAPVKSLPVVVSLTDKSIAEINPVALLIVIFGLGNCPF